MIKSMTGFGRSEQSDGKRNVIVEIRSVNHRYCDVNIKMPKRYSFAEDKIRKVVKDKIKRGKIEVSVYIELLASDDVKIGLNEEMAREYYNTIMRLKEMLNLDGEPSLEFIASCQDVLKATAAVEDEEEVMDAIISPTKEALDYLNDMRAKEGQKLAEDILSRGEAVGDLVENIAIRAEKVPQAYVEKLRSRINDIISGSVEVPEDRILMEAAIFADKCNIDEEITRLYSHLEQLRGIISGRGEGGVGKKLDFLVQEMNREANTIGSKANDIEVTNLMLKLKSEIEKIREQVQNVE